MNIDRHQELKDLFHNEIFFKIIYVAGNEDPEDVKRMSIIYTLAKARNEYLIDRKLVQGS